MAEPRRPEVAFPCGSQSTSKHPQPPLGQGGAEADGGCGLADPALLIAHSYHPRARHPRQYRSGGLFHVKHLWLLHVAVGDRTIRDDFACPIRSPNQAVSDLHRPLSEHPPAALSVRMAVRSAMPIRRQPAGTRRITAGRRSRMNGRVPVDSKDVPRGKPQAAAEAEAPASGPGLLGSPGDHGAGAATAEDRALAKRLQNRLPTARCPPRCERDTRDSRPRRRSGWTRGPSRHVLAAWASSRVRTGSARTWQSERLVVLESHLIPAPEGRLTLRGAGRGKHHHITIAAGPGQRLQFSFACPWLELPGAQEQAPGSSGGSPPDPPRPTDLGQCRSVGLGPRGPRSGCRSRAFLECLEAAAVFAVALPGLGVDFQEGLDQVKWQREHDHRVLLGSDLG